MEDTTRKSISAGTYTSMAKEPQMPTAMEVMPPSRLEVLPLATFKPYTKASYARLLEREQQLKIMDAERAKHAQDAHLVDGELKFGIDDDEQLPPENPDLKEGCLLTKAYGRFPSRFYGRPVEEIDPGIRDKTFIVISKRFKKSYIQRFSATNALWIFPGWNPLRRLMLYIMTNQLFDLLIFLTIITNCVFLAMPDWALSERVEIVFLCIYSVECVIRVVGRGFALQKHTYLRDPWNWLDFAVILVALLTEVYQLIDPATSIGNIQGLRTFRVLRALKTVSIVPGLKTIVSALLRACRMLLEVILLTMFCLMVFAMFGLQVYKGALRQKCVKEVSGYVTNPSQSYNEYYAVWIRNEANWYQDDEGEFPVCGNNTGTGNCPDFYVCLKDIGDNPRWGYMNFDHFGWALLTCFQLITLDFWEDPYGKIIRASGPWNVIFFMIVIFFGSFYLINLMLAVVSMSYEEEAVNAGKEKEREKKENARNKHNAMYDVALGTTIAKKVSSDLTKRFSKAESDQNNSSPVKIASNPVIHTDESHSSSVSPLPEYLSAEEKKIPEKTNGVAEKIQAETQNENMLSDGKVVIFKADSLLDPEIGALKGQVIDRNFDGCDKIFCCCYVNFLKIQNYFFTFVSDPLFDMFITICIVINTIFMSCEHFEQPPWLDTTLDLMNYTFSGVFIFEAVCKILGLGKYYFKNYWNLFDLAIVLASILDMSLTSINAGLNVFRAFRLLRVFKLAQSWPTMRLLLSIILNTLGALGNLCIILAIVIYIFAVIGLQLFRKKYVPENFDEGEGTPRWNFTDFYRSMLMIFRVLCGEWIEASYDCMRAHNELCLLVFLPALVFGNFVVLNLFLALLLNAFASDSLDKQKDSSVERSKLVQGFDRLRHIFCCFCPRLRESSVEDKSQFESNEVSYVNSSELDVVEKPFTNHLQSGSINIGRPSIYDTGSKIHFDDDSDSSEEPDAGPQNCVPDFIQSRIKCLQTFDNTEFGQCWGKFRLQVYRVVNNKIFEGFVLFIILSSSLTLAFEDIYLYQKKELSQALDICNYVFTALFTIEMVIKIIGLGLQVYFTHFWTILDFFIVFVSLLSIVLNNLGGSNNISSFRSLRTLRALRPLRAISRWQGMKIVVNALMNAIPAIVNVLMVCLVFWLIFSILGVQLFKGLFFKCVNVTDGERVDRDIVPNKTICLSSNNADWDWENSNINFDNVAQGFLALFQVATFEGWMEIMSDAADNPGEPYLQPSYENSPWSYCYFVVFIVFGAFFSLNLFIGVIIDNFNVLKKKYEGSYLDAFLTQSQRDYYNTLKRLGKKKPQKTIKRPKNKFQLFFYNMSMSNKFELSIVILIFFNMIVMAIEHYKQPTSVEQGLDMMNIIFTTAFALEAVIKIIGLRFHYFRFLWNIFDFIIVVLSILDSMKNHPDFNGSKSGVLLQGVLNGIFVTPTLLRIIRVFRIGRVLRLIKAAKGIRKLLFALIISLPAIFNIGALLFLIMYMYAIIGMTSFGNIRINGVMDEVVNFQTFGNSFMLLLRLATAAGWNDILDALLIKKPYCNETHYQRPTGEWIKESGGDCSTPWLAIAFMVTYVVIVWLIVINMYIAIILENFSQAHEQEELGITEDDFDMFYVVWEKYDPHATQFIKYEQLADFVGDLEAPLQIQKPNEIALVSFNLPIMEGEKMHCLDILIALVRNVLGSVEETEELTTLKEQMEEKFAQNFPSRVNITVRSSTLQRKKEDVAARTLQRAWRSYKAQKVMRNITALAVKQRLRRASAIGLRSRTDIMKNLGNRLTNALNQFFATRKSINASAFSSTTNLQETSLSKQPKIGQQLKVPQVFTLYPGGNKASSNNIDI